MGSYFNPFGGTFRERRQQSAGPEAEQSAAAERPAESEEYEAESKAERQTELPLKRGTNGSPVNRRASAAFAEMRIAFRRTA